MLLICFAVVLFLYVFARLTRGITRSSTCLIGKTAIVTGANSGLGYEVALNLASRGCNVIMADISDMEESKNNIIKTTNNPNITTKKVDLSSFKSVREFAEDINKTIDRLDILMNNAGIGVSMEHKTKDGLHPVMQINYFSHFLLTHLLIDLLKKSAPSRIVFTSSFLSFTNNLSVKNLIRTGSDLDGVIQRNIFYANSKLGAIIASDIFAEKLKGTRVTSNSLHPGLVTTPIFSKVYEIGNNIQNVLLEFVHKLFAKDAWEGSQTLVHLAVAKELENVSGKFFSDCAPFFKPLCAYKEDFCMKIWEATEKIVDLGPNEKL